MGSSHEEQAVEAVIDRLADRFPQVDRGQIQDVVHDAHHELDGNPIRDYVPVLVEHAARERLQAAGAEPVHISDADAPPAGPMIRAGTVPTETESNSRITLLNGGLGGGTS